MKYLCGRLTALVIFGLFWAVPSIAQTTTVSSGNWSDPAVWSTGVVPGGATNVTVNHPLILDQNITITTGDYLFFADVTDLPGGSNYSLTANTTGGVIDIKSGTTTFGGSGLDNSVLIVRSGATLILGSTTINNNAAITIEVGGTLIINGNFTNNNNGAGLFSVAGTVYIYGNYDAPVGSVEIVGGGNVITTGTITTNGSSEVFGSRNECGAGPCSGQNLCNFSNTITADQTICGPAIPAALSGNAVGGSPTYLWESSTTNATSGFSAAAGTNNGQNYTPGSLAQTTWFRRTVTQGGCTGIAVPVQITVLSGGGWKGTTADWNTASNWCANAVPTSTTDVTINTGAPNMPQITAASNCKNLTINAGASVTINSSNTLSIYGNFTNNGTFTANSSTVTLSGTSAQTVSGSSTFNNLIINNSSGATPAITTSNFVNVNGTLTMTQGLVNLAGYNLTLGTAAATPGTLTYTAGRLYGGSFTRWFNTPTVAIGNVAGLFPLGSTADYRPYYIGYTSALTTGGTIRVGHTSASTTSVVAFADGASTVVRRQDSYWNVGTGNGINVAGTPFLARLEFTALGTVGDITHLRMTRISDVVGTHGTNAGTTTNPQVNRTALSLANLANSFYVGSTDATITPLPVTLLEFSGRMSNSSADLTWSTASERNFDHFEIERMYADGGFESIGEVSAKGSSFSLTKYSFSDVAVQPGSVYYRLKIVDWNNTFEYSKVIHVLAEDRQTWLSVYPNPTVDRKFNLDVLHGQQTPGRVIVYDQLGRTLIDEELPSNTNYFELPASIPSGICFVRVSSSGKQEVIKLLVK